MDKSRKWSFRIQLWTNGIAGLINVHGMLNSYWHKQYMSAGVSSLFLVACSLTAWFVVWGEQKYRIAQQTRESYLKEQEADTHLKEEILEHFRSMKARDPDFSFGFPIDMRSKH